MEVILSRGYSVVPRPVFHDNLVYISSGYDRPTLYAIKTDGSGDVTRTKVAWEIRLVNLRISVVGLMILFMAADNGVVSCLDASTGSTHWIERVGGSCSSSLLHSESNLPNG